MGNNFNHTYSTNGGGISIATANKILKRDPNGIRRINFKHFMP